METTTQTEEKQVVTCVPRSTASYDEPCEFCAEFPCDDGPGHPPSGGDGAGFVCIRGRPLYVFLKTVFYNRFKSGAKNVELRQGKRWGPHQVREGRPVVVRRGMNTPDEFRGRVGFRAFVGSFEDLPEWARLGSGVKDRSELGSVLDPDQPLTAFEVV